MAKLFKYLFLLILIPICISYTLRFCRFLAISFENPEHYLSFGIGILVYLFGRYLLLRRNMEFIRTFNHEFHHLIFSLLFLNKIDSFNAHSMGTGKIAYTGRASFIITLAPYAFSIPVLLLLGLAFIWSNHALPLLDGMLGALLCFHLETLFLQARAYQSDLQEQGLLFSYLFIACMNLLTLFYTMVFVYYNHRAGLNFIKGGFFSFYEATVKVLT